MVGIFVTVLFNDGQIIRRSFIVGNVEVFAVIFVDIIRVTAKKRGIIKMLFKEVYKQLFGEFAERGDLADAIATIVNGIIRAEKMKVVDKTEIFTPKNGLNMPKVPPIRLATTRALKTREYISAIQASLYNSFLVDGVLPA